MGQLASAAKESPLSRVSAEYIELEKNDPLLRDNPQRWVMFPIKYPEVWELYKKHEASFWTAEEIDLSQDNADWDRLTDAERHFIKHILANIDEIGRDATQLASAAKELPLSRVSVEYIELEKNEPLLRDNPQRWVMFPIKHPEVWEMYKKHEASFWTAEEIDLSQDNADWERLTDAERHFIKHILA